MKGAALAVVSSNPIIGQDPVLLSVVARAERVAPTRIPVLISGESGTGKELMAELIHRLGPSSGGPFVAVNCGTLPRELAESELFGHERGAFTGAGRQKAGWFEEADGGTLVLDEIGELALDLQPKLLRVLETGRLRRVGGSGEITVRVRVAAVTHRDLRLEVARGRFRNDLYHRLAGFELPLPPLRRRRGDIPLLVGHFLAALGPELGPRTLDPDAAQLLVGYDWPGNIRELRNVLGRAAVLCPRRITIEGVELPSADHQRTRRAPCEHLADAEDVEIPGASAQVPPSAADPAPPFMLSSPDGHGAERGPERGLERGLDDLVALTGRSFDQIERAVFRWALGRNGGSRRRAARSLGLPRSSFCDKVKRYGLM